MNILILYHGGEFPPAERIEKQAKSLSRAGHSVHLLCNNYGKFARHDEQVDSVHVHRIRPTLKSEAANRILKFPIFLNPLWLAQLFGVIRKYRIQVIQVVDIPLAPAALLMARVCRIPAVMDMWENYPEALKGWGSINWKTALFKNYRIARFVERFSVRRFEHIFTVVEEQRERLIQMDGVPAERISVVSNTVDLETFVAAPYTPETPNSSEGRVEVDTSTANANKMRLMYVGVITVERGLEDIIRSIRLLRDEIPEIQLIIAGKGDFEPQLRHLVTQEQVDAHVSFLGWIPFGEISTLLASSDVCLVPHVDNDFINTTIPNKLFQYMALAKPILVSNAKPLARIVRECNCGYVFESGNPESAAEQIRLAYQNRGNPELGQNGLAWAHRKYNWNTTAETLLAVYQSLGSPHNSQVSS